MVIQEWRNGGVFEREATPEEINMMKLAQLSASIEPTEAEKLRNENKLLTAQVNALTTQNDFQEELIVELASEVYA